MRDAILQLAEQQLMSGGFDKLNFAQIASELNTTRANIHYHFKNKETLAIEVTREYGNKHVEAFGKLRAAHNGNFVGFFQTIDKFFWPEDEIDGCSPKNACTTLVCDPELPESIGKLSRSYYQKIQQIIAGVIQDAIDNKEIRADIDVNREAIRCHVTMMGIGTCGQHLPDQKVAKEQLGGLLVEWANSLK